LRGSSRATWAISPFGVAEDARRLGAGAPPDDVGAQLVELAKGAVDPLVGSQGAIDVARRDAVGQQGDFQGRPRTLGQAALAGQLGNVPEILPGRGGREFVAVPGQHGRHEDGAEPALLQALHR
jgi:hypothetical protein